MKQSLLYNRQHIRKGSKETNAPGPARPEIGGSIPSLSSNLMAELPAGKPIVKLAAVQITGEMAQWRATGL